MNHQNMQVDEARKRIDQENKQNEKMIEEKK